MAESFLKDNISSMNAVIDGLEISTATDELKKLSNRLSTIEAAVERAEKDLALDPTARAWLLQVQDLLNDLLELTEELAAENNQTKRRPLLDSCSCWTTGRSERNHTFKVIGKSLDHVVADAQSLFLPKNADSEVKVIDHEWIKKVKTIDLELINEFAVREKEQKIIQQLLFNTNNPMSIVAIVGIEGLGKTTLAKLVYNQVNAPWFKVWVDSGKSFHVESIVKKIINESEPGKKVEDQIKEDEMPNLLYEAIGGRRYLLVLDDVKSADSKEWDNFIKNILPPGGSILITTRSILVSKITGMDEFPPVALKELSRDDSWSLFKTFAPLFDESDSRNAEIGMMVDKCKGVPLAIKVMGSLWHSQINIKSMEEQFLDRLEQIYCNELVFPLKLCFAFCSVFPDNIFDVPRLINLWIGERFILPRFASPESLDSLECEAVGEEYFEDLCRRSIFQDVQKDELGNPTSCRMHPLMHYLAIFVARDEYISVDPNGKEVKSTVRHASFKFCLDISVPESLSEASGLVTILLPAAKQTRFPHETKMRISTCQTISTKYKSLRVLDLHDLGLKTVHSSISDLSLLRYLDLSRNNIEKLPSSITKLRHLQTLKLSHCLKLKELPKDLDGLTKLRHLEIDGCFYLDHIPEAIKNMTSLRTLSLFMASTHSRSGLTCIPRLSRGSTGSLRELAGLNKLRGLLEITHLERCDALEAVEAKLQEKNDLQCLILRWDHDNNNAVDDFHSQQENDFLENLQPPKSLKALFLMNYGGKTLSDQLSSLQSLVKFSLNNCCNCLSLPLLDQLQLLKILKLQKLNSLEFIVDNSGGNKDNFFLKLKKLTLFDCPNLTSWWKNEIPLDSRPSFPSLSILDIKCCPKLSCMPLCADLDEKLVVMYSRLEPVLDTMRCSNKSASPPFFKLKSMLIANINEDDQPPKGWLENFTSLEHLHIQECHLKSLPEGFQQLTSLKDLTIENCEELDLKKSSEEWKGLQNLRSLTIRGIPKLESLPMRLECIASLQELRLYSCSNLTSLLDNINKLVSLKTLVMSGCNNLASLPEGMDSLKSLDTLIIKNCPKLVLRCQPETGDDWQQIKHIKNRSVTQTSQLS